jgi:hydroxyacylglutathione hydrolase
MQKSVKRTLLIAGVMFVLLVLLVGLRLCFVLFDMRQMATLPSGEIVAGVYAVKDRYVNMYLVKSGGRYIAIDSGVSLEGVRKELQKLNIDSASVSAVFLTHADPDHTGGLHLFQNARIYLGSEEEQMIDGRTARFSFFKNGAIPRHALLKDNQAVEIEGLNVVAILTAGHTPGSTCYLVGGRFLFAGDSMRLRDGKADIFSKALNMDSDVQRESLKKLSKLKGVIYVFTAHFGYAGEKGDVPLVPQLY